jgi:hypothetical protein
MSSPQTIEGEVELLGKGRKLCVTEIPKGRVPRVTRLMALALRFDKLTVNGTRYSELAHWGHVSRARITQIMNLRLLAPDIQEAILFLPLTQRGRDPVHMALLQPIARAWRWTEQRRRWRTLCRSLKSRGLFHNCLEVAASKR